MTPDLELLEASGERESSRGAQPIGTTIAGQYRVLGRLGSGGMADVYEVEHVALGRHFALKLLRSDLAREASVVQRFEREARAVAKLESAHIVAIVDSGFVDDAPYFVMERLYGEELRRLLTRDGPLPIQRAVHIALDVCRALTVAHAAGVIHRDLKPENLFITRSELGTDHCKVLDFGVAKLAGENPTMPGALMGTARYMAPEQISHSTAIAPFTDIFSLGVIVYECLSGQQPFAADTLERVLFKILNETPTPLRELRPEIPAALAELVHRAMAKAGAERPQSAAAFAESLAQFTAERQVAPRLPSSSGEDATLVELERAVTNDLHELDEPRVQRERPSRLVSLVALGLAFSGGLGVGAVAARGDGHAVPPAPPTHAPTSAAARMMPEGAAPAPVTTASAPPAKLESPRASEPRPVPKALPSVVSPAPTPSSPPLFYPADSNAAKN
jgi:eukaryotic-like serine/threonine-protein kinase